jgi:hypothetical protein
MQVKVKLQIFLGGLQDYRISTRANLPSYRVNLLAREAG